MLNERGIEIQIFAHVGILGLLDLKILKVPNYQMFKDKLIPIIAKSPGNSCMQHTKLKRKRNMNTQNATVHAI